MKEINKPALRDAGFIYLGGTVGITLGPHFGIECTDCIFIWAGFLICFCSAVWHIGRLKASIL